MTGDEDYLIRIVERKTPKEGQEGKHFEHHAFLVGAIGASWMGNKKGA